MALSTVIVAFNFVNYVTTPICLSHSLSTWKESIFVHQHRFQQRILLLVLYFMDLFVLLFCMHLLLMKFFWTVLGKSCTVGAGVPDRSWKSGKLSWVLVSICWKINNNKNPATTKTQLLLKFLDPLKGDQQVFWAESRSYPTLFLGGAARAEYFVLISAENAPAQELRESRGGCPGFSVLTNLTVSMDVKQH